MRQVLESTNLKTKNKNLNLREMSLNDVVKMNNLFVQSVEESFNYFPLYYKKKLCKEHSIPRLIKAYFSPYAHFNLLSLEGRDIGYCLLRTHANRAYLYWMFVQPDYRGLNAGRSLLFAALDTAQRLGMEAVELVTHDKEGFYIKYGFISIKRIVGLVGNIDMTVMEYRF
jgi:GNAT superfamily N-acetyltransferase